MRPIVCAFASAVLACSIVNGSVATAEDVRPDSSGVGGSVVADDDGPVSGNVAGDDGSAGENSSPVSLGLSGYINTTYSYDLNNPQSGETFGRSYDRRHNNIRFNNAHVGLDGKIGSDVEYVIGVDFGADAADHRSSGFGMSFDNLSVDPACATCLSSSAVDVDPDADIVDLEEAYVSFTFKPTRGTIKAGKFATFSGIEVIESGANPTITRGWLFGGVVMPNGTGYFPEPFTHVGIVYSQSLGPVTLTGGVVNGWDLMVDSNKLKTGVGQISLDLGEKVGSVNLQAYAGSEDTNNGLGRNSFDIVGVINIIPRTELWWQANYNDQQNAGGGVAKFGGATLQPVISLTDSISIGFRYEYFEINDGGVATFQNGTVAPSIKVASSTWVRAEYRHDASNLFFFDDDKGNLKRVASTVTAEVFTRF